MKEHWCLGGLHYRKTLEAWLQRMDRHRHEVITLFQDAYGVDRALSRWVRWRVFFMACSELFGYRGGREWIVSHYLFRK